MDFSGKKIQVLIFSCRFVKGLKIPSEYFLSYVREDNKNINWTVILSYWKYNK